MLPAPMRRLRLISHIAESVAPAGVLAVIAACSSTPRQNEVREAAQTLQSRIDIRVAHSSDDAEEGSYRWMTLSSRDLELTHDARVGNQRVAARFAGVSVPPRAMIVRAHVVFTADEVGSGRTSLVIRAEDADDAARFSWWPGNISSRVLTTASVSWSPEPWTAIGATYQTPDISPVIQRVVDRAGWRAGNAIVVVISGAGRRTAEAYDGDPSSAPLLHVEYAEGGSQPKCGDDVCDASESCSSCEADCGACPDCPTTRFAVIGDYGLDGPAEMAVASLVKSWNPGFIVTVGDNNYPNGSASTIDANVGKYYHDYIGSYHGTYGDGSVRNRFWPSPGNHDWYTPGLQPYLDYFDLPGNERYYDVKLGPVHLYAIDSDTNEPDGVTGDSAQASWLRRAMESSTACWKVVAFHHAPYSSGAHGSSLYMRWPFEAWGADAVFAGHDHVYERLQVGGIPYFVTGTGGARLYGFGTVQPQSVVRYNQSHGAVLVEADACGNITYQFYSIDGTLQDAHSVTKRCP